MAFKDWFAVHLSQQHIVGLRIHRAFETDQMNILEAILD